MGFRIAEPANGAAVPPVPLHAQSAAKPAHREGAGSDLPGVGRYPTDGRRPLSKTEMMPWEMHAAPDMQPVTDRAVGAASSRDPNPNVDRGKVAPTRAILG